MGRRKSQSRNASSQERWSGQAPLRLLVGPYVHACHCEYMNGAFDDYDTITFGSWAGADLPTANFCSLDDVLGQLPAGWQPDLMLLWRPEVTFLPKGIEHAAFPVAMLISDWYVAFTACLEAARFVNLVITGTRGERVFRTAGFDHVIAMPMLGYQSGFDGRVRQRSRDIDVLCAGNPNWSVHREREQVNAELMTLPRTVNFVHAPFVSREEYNGLLGRSKIFVNQTVIGEINMKVYEATAAETCLFVEEDNLDVRNYLVPGESVVLFRRGDLNQKILYYLEHEAERRSIAQAGRRAMRERSYRANMFDIVERLRGIGRDVLMDSGREILRAPHAAVHAHFSGYSMHRYQLDPLGAVGIANDSAAGPPIRRAYLLRFAQLAARAKAAFCDTEDPRWALVPEEAEIVASLHELWRSCTDDLCLNLAWMMLAPRHRPPAEAEAAFERVLSQLASGGRIPLGGSAFYPMSERRRFVFERLAWEQVERAIPPDEALRAYLLEFAHLSRSEFARSCAERKAAAQASRQAVASYPQGEDARPLLASDLRELGEYDEAITVLGEHLEQRPLDLLSRVTLIDLHPRTGRPDRAEHVIDEVERVAEVFGDAEWIARIPRLRKGVPATVARGAVD